MSNITEKDLDFFLLHQAQLLGKDVFESREEAEEFLEESLSQVCRNLKEVREYLDECGMDISGMNDSELAGQSEVFQLPGGTFLVVGG